MTKSALRVDQTGINANAASWLTPALSASWHWDEDGAAVLWEDDTTIVMAEELAQICERNGALPLPPPSPFFTVLAALKGRLPAQLPLPAREALRQFATWPAKLTQTVSAKQVLLQMLFGANPGKAPSVSGTELAKLVRLGWRPAMEDGLSVPFDDSFSHEGFMAALRRVSPEALARRLETGLEDEISPTGQLPDVEGFSPGKLLEELAGDPETAGILRLTRDVMAALTLPQAMFRQEESAAGGVSDISNRGPLHRLLLSELAYDDDLLAARLALNEALYLQPEPPAHRPPGALVLVLDAGLRLWGLPRVFATSVALALRLKARAGTSPAVWRATGTTWSEVSLDTAEGIKEHLAALEAGYDLTPALPSLSQKLENAPTASDIVLLVHERTLAHPSFTQSLAIHLANFTPLHIVSVEGEGRMALHQFSPQGLKLLHQAKLRLQTVLESESRHARERRTHGMRQGRSLPAVLFLQRLPFLVAPVSGLVATATVRGETVLPLNAPGVMRAAHQAPFSGPARVTFGLTQRKEVWYRVGSQQGARPLPLVPLRGKLLVFQTSEGPEPALVAASWDQAGGQVYAVHVPAAPAEAVDAPQIWAVGGLNRPPDACWVDDGHLMLLAANGIRALRLRDGVELPRHALPSNWDHMGDRYFCSQRDLLPAMVHRCFARGGSIAFLALGKSEQTHPALAFHREGLDGVWLVGWDGSISSIDGRPGYPRLQDNEKSPRYLRVSHAKASADGRQVWMKTSAGPCFIRDLESDELRTPVPDQSQWPCFVETGNFVHFTMRVRFDAIGATANGDIALRTPRGKVVVILLSSAWFRLENKPDAVVHQWRDFGTPEGTEHYCVLRVAEWENGSRAFLDDRGLLHLQGNQENAPELTIGLPASMMLPVWSSDGLMVGPAATMESGAPTTKDAPAIAAHLKRFALEILH